MPNRAPASRARPASARIHSGGVALPTPIMPRPPPAVTAAASPAPETPAIGAPITGTSMASRSVSAVRSMRAILAAPGQALRQWPGDESGAGERRELAAARLPGAAGADPAARRRMAPDQEPGRDLPAELGGSAAGQQRRRAGAAQAAAGDHRDVRHGGAVVLPRARGRAGGTRRVPGGQG